MYSFFIKLKRKFQEHLRNAKEQKIQKIAQNMGIKLVGPNYTFIDNLNEDSIFIDVGCGFDADFSVYMIERYGFKAYGVDPTRKHKRDLEDLEKKTLNKFKYVPLAVAAEDGEILFNESKENVSGSIIKEHANVRNDTVTEYKVSAVTLRGLLRHLNLQKADYIKLDLEGGEFDLVEKLDVESSRLFDQIFIEFHHHCVPRYSLKDVKRAIAKMESLGFQSFSFDSNNYLFFKPSLLKR